MVGTAIALRLFERVWGDKDHMKTALVRAAAWTLRPLLRGGLPRGPRARLHREMWRWINWRGLEFVARTEAGARMRLNSRDLIQQ